MDETNERLRAEIEHIGVTFSEFARLAGSNGTYFNRRLYGTSKFSITDIINYGTTIQNLGGDPVYVFPEFESLKKANPELKPNKSAVPKFQVKPSFGVPIFEGSTKKRTSKHIVIPGLDDLDIWLRCYDRAVLPKYLPGQLFGLKKIDLKNILYGKLYYLAPYDSIRTISQSKRPDTLLINPINPEYQSQEIFSNDLIIWEVKAVIEVL